MQSKNIWTLLLETCLFGSKKNINYWIKCTLNLFNSYQSSFCSWNKSCDSGKCPFGEISFGELSVREMYFRGILRSGNCPSGNCPLGKCSSGTCPSENCPDTDSLNLFVFTYLFIYLFNQILFFGITDEVARSMKYDQSTSTYLCKTIWCHQSFFYTPWKLQKPGVYWCFQGI